MRRPARRRSTRRPYCAAHPAPDRMRHVLLQTFPCLFLPDPRHAGADARAAVQERDIFQAAVRSRANGQIRSEHFNGGFSVQFVAHGVAAQFRKQVRRLGAKPEMMRFANHGAAAVPHEAAGIVRDIRPSSPRAGVSQRALTHTGLAVKQHAGSLPSDASCVQGGEIVQLQQHVNLRVQKMPAEKDPVRYGGARHAAMPEPLPPVDDREIIPVRYPLQQVPLAAQDWLWWPHPASLAGEHVQADGRAVEPGRVSAKTLLGGIQHFAHIARDIHRESVWIVAAGIGQRRAIQQWIVDFDLDSVGSGHLLD